MSNLKVLSIVLVPALVLVAAVSLTVINRQGSPNVSFKEPSKNEIHLRAQGKRVEVNNPDATKVYIVESGADVVITAPLSDPARTPSVRVIAAGGSHLEAHGTNVDVTAQPDSDVTAYDGVVMEATGARVTVKGDVKLKAFAGTVVHNNGLGEEFAYAGSITYTQMKGRTFASTGATVYAKSPENCDACTQVYAGPGSIIHVYEGAEAFGKGATVYVYKGGEVGCAHDCTLYLDKEAEFNYGPRCTVNKLTAENGTADPFKDGEDQADDQDHDHDQDHKAQNQ